MTLRELLAKLRDWRSRDRLDAELAEEIQFHREQLERDGGIPATRRLGNLTRLKEDAATLAGVTALLVVVAAVATFIPARRATRIDVVTVLREE